MNHRATIQGALESSDAFWRMYECADRMFRANIVFSLCFFFFKCSQRDIDHLLDTRVRNKRVGAAHFAKRAYQLVPILIYIKAYTRTDWMNRNHRPEDIYSANIPHSNEPISILFTVGETTREYPFNDYNTSLG